MNEDGIDCFCCRLVTDDIDDKNYIDSVLKVVTRTHDESVSGKRIKIILDWGEFPWDLDAHVVDGENHVFFSVKKEGNLELDRDDVNSYGPETITIVEPAENKKYSYYVHDCSNTGINSSKRLSNSQAQVRVYFDNEYKTSFKIKTNKEGFTWHVFDIVKGDQIVPKEKISTKSPKDY